jgi:hypothetical protein
VATLAVNVARHQSTDPKKCRKYVTEVTNYLWTSVFERATQLDLQSDIRGFNLKSPMDGRKIDRDLLRANLHAERLTNAEIDQRGHPNYTKPR